jgi:hypothetical protein
MNAIVRRRAEELVFGGVFLAFGAALGRPLWEAALAGFVGAVIFGFSRTNARVARTTRVVGVLALAPVVVFVLAG